MRFERKSFRECAQLIRDSYNPSANENLPYVGLEHIGQQTLRLNAIGSSSETISNKLRFRSGDILFGKLRPYFRKVVMPKFDGVCSTDIFVIRAKEGTDQKFLYYWLASEDFITYATAGSEGTKMPRAKWEFLERLEKEIPTLPEQRRIGEILGAIDDKIELNIQMNKTLEEMAAAIFKSWFIDFEPFKDAEFVESDLGLIPKRWEVLPLPRVMEINPHVIVDKEITMPYVAMADLPMGGSRVSDWRKRRFKGSGSRFENGDVLLARITPCLENGKTAYIDFLKSCETGWGSTEFIVLRARPFVSSIWVYSIARSDDFRAFAIQSMTGTSGRQRVQASSFNHYEVAVPPPEVLAQFQKKIQTFFITIKANDDESYTLAQSRDTLLPKLLSGEIRLMD